MLHIESGKQILHLLENSEATLEYGVPVLGDLYEKTTTVSSDWDYEGPDPEVTLIEEVEQFTVNGIIGAFILSREEPPVLEMWVPWR